MKENNRSMLIFMISLLVLGMVNLVWAIIKSIQLKWALFNIKGIDILVAYGVSVYLLHFSSKALFEYGKHKKIEHGYDERNTKILDKSLRNVSIVMLVIMLASYYYVSLFRAADVPVYPLISLNYVLVPALIVFIVSFNHYSKSRQI